MLSLLEDRKSRTNRSFPDEQARSAMPPALTVATLLCLFGAIATLVPFWPSIPSWRKIRACPTSGTWSRGAIVCAGGSARAG